MMSNNIILKNELVIDFLVFFNIGIIVNCVFNVVLMFIVIIGNFLVIVVIWRILIFCMLFIMLLCSLVVLDFFVGFVV